MNLSCYLLLAILALSRGVPVRRPERQVLELDDPAAANFTANEVCFSDNEIYQRGDIMPNPGPCEECKCEPPSIVCQMTKCPVSSGCRTIQRANHCCPDYKCDCEHNGDIFNNGERIDTPDEPCQVCYCKGGEVMCNSITCYQRDDCEPQVVPGQCCPKFDHCPLRDMPSSGDIDESGMRNKSFINIPKQEMQPWLLTKSANVNTKQVTTSERRIEEVTTDKPTQQTEVIVSDWLSERRTTTDQDENSDKTEESTSSLDSTTLDLGSNIIEKENEETTLLNDESAPDLNNGETTTSSYENKSSDQTEDIVDNVSTTTENIKNEQDITEKQRETTTTNDNDLKNEFLTTKQTFENNSTHKSTILPPSEENTSMNELSKLEVTTTESIDTIKKEDENKNIDESNSTNDTTSVKALSEDKSNPSSYFEIDPENYQFNVNEQIFSSEGSGDVDPVGNEKNVDAAFHEDLSEYFEGDTTEFNGSEETHTTPVYVVITGGILKNEINSKEDMLNNGKQQTESFDSSTTERNDVTTLPSKDIVENNKSNNPTEIVSTTLFDDNIVLKIDPLEVKTVIPNNSVIANLNDESVTNVENSTSNDINNVEMTTSHDETESLKEVLMKEDTNESEIEENSEEKNFDSKRESGENIGNKEEKEESEQPPVLELNNQLPFLQLGGHGSSESSTLYSLEVDVVENTEQSNDNSTEYQTSQRITVPNTSKHITLTPGDLKILAEYMINETIKPINNTLNNETSTYVPTEWLKGNLTSDIKIASILSAANVSIGIMNKTDFSGKIKPVESVEEITNISEIVKTLNSKMDHSTEKSNNTNQNSRENEMEKSNIDKVNAENKTISTKLSISKFENLENKTKDTDIGQARMDDKTENKNVETEMFEVVTTRGPEISNLPSNSITTLNMDEVVTERISTENINDFLKTIQVTRGKVQDVSASRKVRIPDLDSITKEPFTVNLEENDITIVTDFIKKNMPIP